MFGNRIKKSMLRNSYLVTLDTGDAFSGVLDESDDNTLVLQQVIAFDRDGQHPVDNRIIISYARVAYIQELRP